MDAHNPPATAPSAPAQPTPTGPLLAIQNDGGAREFLNEYHWPYSLQDALLRDIVKVPLRFFICDDSGSMSANDGKRLVNVGGTTKFAPCSRWAELTTALKFHAGLAHHGLIPTEFRLLNAAAPLRVGFSQAESAANVTRLTSIFEDSPSGGTPLCSHIREIIQQIQQIAPTLRQHNQRACIIIATDGESSDGDVAEALRPLKDLPAWVVVRLCTDDEKVVDYWNNIDNVLELNVDVLDDLAGEANEVHKNNPWLTYAEPLHRMREFGVSSKEFDLLDEKLLPPEHMRKIATSFLGDAVNALPLPEVDMKGFIRGIEK
ncbi:hypothetical protein EON64_07745, partial [archaeon]